MLIRSAKPAARAISRNLWRANRKAAHKPAAFPILR